tara:strand:- start:98 stop:394 length:297 start_codon:yes stop_codon:yes gene_type:complete
MSLQFTSLDDAFSPISQKKKRERKAPEIQEELPEHQVVVPQHPITQPAPIAPAPRLADEIFAMQPYFNNLFMIFVLGMLYDMRQAALDIKAHLMVIRS